MSILSRVSMKCNVQSPVFCGYPIKQVTHSTGTNSGVLTRFYSTETQSEENSN